ncbi:hypothetical protein [Paraglaciecola sp. L3A3]|uniref:hypothetical protein n=1 Tax=Paraglaciecola sp. L3A3 TaxID=2686358 RepID=UPI00131C4218|nr:hypothetical protein [Paraglaciecola sp. L3A3]
MSELEAHQTIGIFLGMLSGVCLVMFITTLNVGFAMLNMIGIHKVLSGMTRYAALTKEKRNGYTLLSFAIWRFF